MNRSDTGPWAAVPEWVLNRGVSDRAIHLYTRLSLYADYETGRAWPSRRALATDLGCSMDSIDRALAELVICEAIEIQSRRRDNGSKTSNVYVVLRSLPAGLRLGGGTDAATPLGTGAA